MLRIFWGAKISSSFRFRCLGGKGRKNVFVTLETLSMDTLLNVAEEKKGPRSATGTCWRCLCCLVLMSCWSLVVRRLILWRRAESPPQLSRQQQPECRQVREKLNMRLTGQGKEPPGVPRAHEQQTRSCLSLEKGEKKKLRRPSPQLNLSLSKGCGIMTNTGVVHWKMPLKWRHRQ